jgi:hypothetical protein
MARVTLDTIAREMGLSKFAVSRALSGKDGVSDETRRRVEAVAAQMGYVKLVTASRLPSVALVFNDTDPQHRMDARYQIGETPVEQFDPADRRALARRMDDLPGGPDLRRRLAADLMLWAEGHGTKAEQIELGDTFATVEWDDLRDRAALLRGEQPRRRGLFSRRD